MHGVKMSSFNDHNDKQNKYNDIFNPNSNEYFNLNTDKIQSTKRILKNDEKQNIINIKYNGKEYNHNHKKNLIVVDLNKNNIQVENFKINNNKWNYKKTYKEENFISENSIKYDFNNKNQEEIEIYNKNKFKSKSKNIEFNTNCKSFDNDNFLKLKTNGKGNKLNSLSNFLLNYEGNLSIATLDLNGNFNLYTNKRNKVLFNLYNISIIEQK